jgi:hypothetical protein
VIINRGMALTRMIRSASSRGHRLGGPAQLVIDQPQAVTGTETKRCGPAAALDGCLSDGCLDRTCSLAAISILKAA